MSRATRLERAAEAGFTLLEVLVALALLAAAMASLGSLSSVGRRANRVEIERVELAQVARRLVNELTERSFAGGSTGTMDGYAWRIDVEPMAAAARPPLQPSLSETLQQPQQSPQAIWIPFRVIVRIAGPTGASAEIVTVRLGRAAS